MPQNSSRISSPRITKLKENYSRSPSPQQTKKASSRSSSPNKKQNLSRSASPKKERTNYNSRSSSPKINRESSPKRKTTISRNNSPTAPRNRKCSPNNRISSRSASPKKTGPEPPVQHTQIVYEEKYLRRKLKKKMSLTFSAPFRRNRGMQCDRVDKNERIKASLETINHDSHYSSNFDPIPNYNRTQQQYIYPYHHGYYV